MYLAGFASAACDVISFGNSLDLVTSAVNCELWVLFLCGKHRTVAAVKSGLNWVTLPHDAVWMPCLISFDCYNKKCC